MARDVALEVLRRVATRGAFGSAALRAIFDERSLVDRDRGLATELVYGVLRRRAQLDKAISKQGKRLKDLDPRLHDVLRLGAYQILFLDRVPDHAAVDAAVEQAKRRRGPRGGGQTNAILRKLAKDPRVPKPPDFKADPVGHVALAGSVSRAIAERLVDDLGPEAARDLTLASLERAPLVLRVNRLRATRDEVVAEVGGTPGAHDWAVHLSPSLGALPADLPCVREGRATVQDEASMHVIDLLDPQPGERILDVCAAPGGKSTCIAEIIGDDGTVVAHDRTPEKLAVIEASAARLGLSCITTVDVLPSVSDTFDRVVVDAPCSGLGTMRRHPEIRWRYRADDLERLTRVQHTVLRSGAARVRPGGVLVYSVCTVTAAEGEAMVEGLDGFEVTDTRSSRPDEPGAPDAFFAARLVRK